MLFSYYRACSCVCRRGDNRNKSETYSSDTLAPVDGYYKSLVKTLAILFNISGFFFIIFYNKLRPFIKFIESYNFRVFLILSE